jgi:hypothetical protein
MPLRITIEPDKDYFLVESQTGNFWDICECLGREFKISEYPDKNAIWVFSDLLSAEERII